MSLRSSLARHVASGPTSEADVKAKAAAAWHRDGVILIKPEWLSGWADQKQLLILAEKAFGARKHKGN